MTVDGFLAHVRRRWWFVAAEAVVAAVVVTLVVAVTGTTSYTSTSHFVLHPDPSAPVGDVTNSIDVLQQDGPLVQTVLKVLTSPEMFRRGATAAGVRGSGYRLDATVSPGSNFFDLVVSGPDEAKVSELGVALQRVASDYVESSYHGFRFDMLGRDTGTKKSFPPGPDVLLLALVLGAAAAIAELFVEFAAAQARRERGAPDDGDARRLLDAPPVRVGAAGANGNGNGNGRDGAGAPPAQRMSAGGRNRRRKRARKS